MSKLYSVVITAIIAVIAPSSMRTLYADPRSGTIVGWGDQVVGVDLSQGFVSLAAGGEHSLALNADGSIVAWGWNEYAQTNVPAPNVGFIAVAAGGYHSLGIRIADPLPAWVWGDANGDRIVDLTDAAALANRIKGPNQWPSVTVWHLLDFDHDLDVDLLDVAAFQIAFSNQL